MAAIFLGLNVLIIHALHFWHQSVLLIEAERRIYTTVN